MDEKTPRVAKGEEFVVFYRGGPYDGQYDRRVATEDGWPEEVTVIALDGGFETMLVYADPVARAVGRQIQVTYTWDREDSDPVLDHDGRSEH